MPTSTKWNRDDTSHIRSTAWFELVARMEPTWRRQAPLHGTVREQRSRITQTLPPGYETAPTLTPSHKSGYSVK
jgi:ribosomal protein L32E